MKKSVLAILAAALCTAVLVGCNNADAPEPQTQTDNNASEAAKSTETAEAKTVNPLPVTVDLTKLDNCTVAVSLEKGDAFVDDEGKMQMNLTVYTHDLYDMVDIAELKEGDTIVRLGKEMKITDLERKDTGLVVINGDLEKGGFSLYTDDSTVYYEQGFDDVKAYYEVGKVTLPVSTEFVYTDASNLDAEPAEYYPGDFLTDEAGIEYDFNKNNTTIVIENGLIIAMNKQYTP